MRHVAHAGFLKQFLRDVLVNGTGLLCVCLVAAWIISGIGRFYVQRGWVAYSMQSNLTDPSERLVSESKGGWTLTSTYGAAVFSNVVPKEFKYTDKSRWVPPQALTVTWAWGLHRVAPDDTRFEGLQFGYNFLGFSRGAPLNGQWDWNDPGERQFDGSAVAIPYWAPVLLTAIPVFVSRWRDRRTQRRLSAGGFPVLSLQAPTC